MINDLRYAIRMFLKNPSSTVVVMVSLALGIGVNTTIFSFVNTLLLRPPAVEAAEELLEIFNEDPNASSNFERYLPLSYPDYAYFRDNNQVFSHLLAFDGDPAFISWSRAGEGEMIQGQTVSGNFFSLLRVRAALGRTFLPEEDQVPGTHPVIVLSYPFWKERLGGDPGVLGRALTLNGQSFTVIGVAPQGFTGLLVGIAPDVWIPIMMAPQLSHDPERLIRRGSHWLFAVGRLRPGGGLSQAKADVRLLADQIERAHPEARERLGAAVFPTTLVPGPYRGYVGAFIGLLMVAVIFVLLIACANAASLLLARATSRRREIAIRSALGASRGRLIRQALIESILLASASGAASLILTSWAVPLLLNLRPPTIPIRFDVPLDYRVLGFTLMISFLAGILFGTGPALQGTRFDLGPSLKDGTYSGASRRSRLHSLLVGGQLAACLVLLVGGGLCLRSLYNVRSIDPGFEVQGRLAGTVDLESLNYSEVQGKAFLNNWVERIEALPGIESVGLASYLPLETTSMGLAVQIEGFQPVPGQEALAINTADVGPDYFKTMGTPVLRGREFTPQDSTAAPRVVVINEAMANRFWPGQDPIGRRLAVGDLSSPQKHEIVGVVKTGKYRTLSEDSRPFIFRSILQQYHPKTTLVAHTAGDPMPLLAGVRRELQALDPNLVLVQLNTLEQHLAFVLFPARATATVLGILGLLALLLAVSGLGGVIAYWVSQRTHEIGVRLALGAQQSDVLQLVVKQGMKVTFVGMFIGLGLAFGLTHFLSSLLYGIGAGDPLTFGGVSILLVGVALLACYIPARRAAKVDPVVALRYE